MRRQHVLHLAEQAFFFRVAHVGEVELDLDGFAEEVVRALLARSQRVLLSAGGELEHFRAQAGGAVGDGQAHQVGLVAACEVGVDFHRRVDLLPLLGELDQLGRGVDLREQGELALFNVLHLQRDHIAVGLERAVRQHAAQVLEVQAGAVLLRVVVLGHLRQPVARDDAAVGRGALGGDAEKFHFGCPCRVR